MLAIDNDERRKRMWSDVEFWKRWVKDSAFEPNAGSVLVKPSEKEIREKHERKRREDKLNREKGAFRAPVERGGPRTAYGTKFGTARRPWQLTRREIVARQCLNRTYYSENRPRERVGPSAVFSLSQRQLKSKDAENLAGYIGRVSSLGAQPLSTKRGLPTSFCICLGHRRV